VLTDGGEVRGEGGSSARQWRRQGGGEAQLARSVGWARPLGLMMDH
jgi:hypothetical protein